MKTLIVIISLSLLLVAGGAFAQNKIYKITDKDGNVVYTDQPPPDGAVPMNLPGLSIVSPRENQQSVRPLNVNRRGDPQADVSALPPLAELLQIYSGAEIVTPQQDESLWGTGNSVNVTVDLKDELLPGLMVQLIFDGRTLPPRATTAILLEDVDRGAHTIQAEVVTVDGQIIGRTNPVNFFMRQHSVNFRRAGN